MNRYKGSQEVENTSHRNDGVILEGEGVAFEKACLLIMLKKAPDP